MLYCSLIKNLTKRNIMTKQFDRNVFETFLQELTNAKLDSDDKSLLVSNMLSICTFEEQEEFAISLRKKGFVLNLYQNPTPVSNAVIPVSTDEGIRLLSVVRNIDPCRGEVGLPGGYVDKLETFEQAAARETFEETGLLLRAEDFSLMLSRVTPQNNTLVFCNYNHIVKASDIDMSFSNSETQKIVLSDPTQSFCFPSHQEVAKKFWENLKDYL
jgi:8-oxo-dGTP diphosphatase